MTIEGLNGVVGRLATALKKTIATGTLATAVVLGLTTSLVVRHAQAGQDSGPSVGVESKKTLSVDPAHREAAPKDQASAEELVKQLDSKDFHKREAAEKTLMALGAKAMSAVRAGTKSPQAEVVQRCERLLALIHKVELARFVKEFAADTDRTAPLDHPIWKRYASMVGDSKPSRELLAAIVKREVWARNLDAAESDPAKAGDIYREAVREVGKLTLSYSTVSFSIPIWPCDQPEEVAYLLLLGSYKNTDPASPLVDHDMSARHFDAGESRIQFARGLGLGLHGKRLAIDPKKADRSIEVDDGYGNAAESGRVMLMLLAYWLEQRNQWLVVSEHTGTLNDDQVKRLLPFARQVIAEKNASIFCRPFWISVLRRFGDASDAIRLSSHFTDKTSLNWPTTNRFGMGPGNVMNDAQMREVAIGSAIFLRGRDPVEFGFTGLTGNKPAKKREDAIESRVFAINQVGPVGVNEKTLAKAIEWLSNEAKKDASK